MKRNRLFGFCSIFLAVAVLGAAIRGSAPRQARPTPPSTDIFLLDLQESGFPRPAALPRNITERDGYDNQPAFSPDGKTLLFNSDRDGQNEIYRYEIATGKVSRLTDTREGEYSPTFLPADPGFSVVRTEADGAQRLWKFDAQGKHPTLLFPGLKPVGYHAWGDPERVALFILGSPPTLQLANLGTGTAETIASGIGRCLQKVPHEEKISFVLKKSPEEWWIQVLDLDTKAVTPRVRTLKGSEDYAWTPGGLVLMAAESKLFAHRAGATPEWQEIADWTSHGIRKITRLSVSPTGNRLALVANHPANRSVP